MTFGCNEGSLSAVCYLVGCIQLIPASILILPSFPIESWYLGMNFKLGIIFFISATAFLAFIGIIDFIFSFHKYISLSKYKRSPSVNSESLSLVNNKTIDYPISTLFVYIFYMLGGIFFLLGSLFYYPDWGNIVIFNHPITLIGTYIFRFGSIFYICGSILSLYKIYKPTNNSMNKVKSEFELITDKQNNDTIISNNSNNIKDILLQCIYIIYIIGAILYIIGGILFETNNNGGEFSWLIGSIFFFVGALLGFIFNIAY